MKVFFNASIRGKEIHAGYYKKIYDAIESLGYTLLDRYLLDNTAETHYQRLEAGGEEEYTRLYDYIMDSLRVADINIFECSLPSLGTGYQVEKSLQFNKPTIVLYLNDHIPHFLAGVKDEKLVLKSVNEKNIKDVLSSALNEARQRADKRFNFFISPKLLEYLEQVSKDEGITKSKFIRNLIVEHMRKSSNT
jgi:hypothetical protein